MIDFSNITAIALGVEDVLQIQDSLGTVLWQKAQPVVADYFYIEDTSGNGSTLKIRKNYSDAPTIEVFSSTDGTNWTSMGTTDITDITANVPANGKLYLKATANQWGNASNRYNYIYTTQGNFNVGGNIMSLLVGDNFENATLDSNYQYQFNSLFTGCTTIIDASALELPSNVTGNCYYQMFKACSSLTTAPVLPVTDLTGGTGCYNSMFWGTSLTTAPALPATTLAESCYYAMFLGCDLLTTAPALPATTAPNYCYANMFKGCDLLTTAPALPATTLANGCYQDMFNSCTSLTTAPTLPATTMAQECYRGMFGGCTSLTTMPALPATTLAWGCYYAMFIDCSSLTTTSTISATTIVESACGEMFCNCTSLVTAPALPATTVGYNGYNAMFRGCTSLVNAPALPATNLTTASYMYMFNNCTSLTTAPALPATNLDGYVYGSMFRGCSNLTSVTIYADTYQAGWADSLDNWLKDVAASGDFYNLGQATYTADSPSGVPYGWTVHTSLPDYFYVEDASGSDNTLSIVKSGANAPAIEVYKSTDQINWTSMGTTSTTAITATIPANSKLYLKCTTNTWANQTSPYFNIITASGNHNVGGNIMSLLNGSNAGATLNTWYFRQFDCLFHNNTHLIDASALQMANNAAQSCYYAMFEGCTSLTTAPALPATTMDNYCYQSMFEGCTSLTTAPALPATTLDDQCYANMFKGCTSLTTAPALPATTLAGTCYAGMFQGCTSLTTAPVLAATAVPVYAYGEMFDGCTSLNRIETYADTIGTTALGTATDNWLNNVAATGDFYNLGSATYTTGASGIPQGWTVHTSL